MSFDWLSIAAPSIEAETADGYADLMIIEFVNGEQR